MRREYHGGQNARDWRRKVTALARKQKENVFTYKFKLDVQDGDIDFDAAARAYDVTEGIARGSLIGLVCAVHLSRFRLFSNEAKTRQFVNRSRYPEAAFAEALHAHTEIENAAVTVRSIENVFTTPPRKSGGVARPWSADELARRLFQAWNNRSPRETEGIDPRSHWPRESPTKSPENSPDGRNSPTMPRARWRAQTSILQLLEILFQSSVRFHQPPRERVGPARSPTIPNRRSWTWMATKQSGCIRRWRYVPANCNGTCPGSIRHRPNLPAV